MTEAPARVLGTCLTVVATTKIIARPNATENAVKIKRGAITCSLLDLLYWIIYRGRIYFRSLLGDGPRDFGTARDDTPVACTRELGLGIIGRT
jgi:hypothetical protein